MIRLLGSEDEEEDEEDEEEEEDKEEEYPVVSFCSISNTESTSICI